MNYQLHLKRATHRAVARNAVEAIAHWRRQGVDFGLADLYVWTADRWRPVEAVRVRDGGMARVLEDDR